MYYKIKQIIDDACLTQNFSGTVLVKHGDEILFETACGFAHKGFQLSNRIDTMFDTASVTKVFTATRILQLIENGMLRFDDRITALIDLNGTEIPDDVTIYHLLTHTSGIADDADEEAGEDYAELFIDKPNYSLRSTIDYLPQFVFKKPNFKAGANVRYNNCAFILLGLVIEKLTGEDYRSNIVRCIFEPCGMKNSKFCAMDEINPNTAEGYCALYDENQRITRYKKNIYSYPPIGAPDGGAYSTVHDLDRFLCGLKSGRLLSKEYVQMLFEPHCEFSQPYRAWKNVPAGTLFNGYAFEFVRIGKQTYMMKKDGMNAGVRAMLSYFPQTDITIIMLCNQDCNIWTIHRDIQSVLYSAVPVSPDNR